MAIKREDVRKKIDFDSAMKGQKGSAAAKQTFATDQVPGTSYVSSNLRTRTKPSVKQNERFRIDRMNTAEFDNLLGDGPTPDVIEDKKKLVEQRKRESNLKLNAICQLNDEVMKMRDESNALEPSNHVTEETLDKTLPLDDPSLDDVGNDSDGQANDAGNTTTPTVTKQDNALKDSSVNQTPATEVQPPTECKDIGMQTDPVLVGCSCQRCQAIFDGVKLLVNAAETNECQFLKTSQEGSKSNLSTLGSLLSTSGHEKHDTPLYVGSTIMLSATDKAMLKDLNPMDDEPRDFLNLIMDNLYTPETMSHMSAMGRTENSIKMDPTIFKQIFAYLKHKFKDTDISIKKSTVVNLVNAKCYAMRRQCWGKMRKSGALPENNNNSTSGSLPARAPLQKKTRNPNSTSQKDSGKSTKKKTDDSEENPVQSKEMTSKSDRREISLKRRKEDDNRTRKSRQQRKSDEEKRGEERRVNRERSSEKEGQRGERKEKGKSSEEEKRGRGRSSDEEKKGRWKSSEKEVCGGQRKNKFDSDGIKRNMVRSMKPQFFQSDASKHFPYSPLKGRKSPSKKSHKTSRVVDSLSVMKKASKHKSEISTSTPKFGGKRPKPLQELVEMTYNKQNSEEDSFELREYELDNESKDPDQLSFETEGSQSHESGEDSDDSSMGDIESN